MKLFARLSGIITFLFLLICAVIFYKERTLTLDVALQDFTFIVKRNFVVSMRLGAILPQIIPLTACLLNLPLKWILLTHSIAFVLYYAAFFCLINFGLKQYWIAFIFVLSLILLVSDSFYWMMSEIPQGLALIFLLYAWIEKKGPSVLYKKPLLVFSIILFIQFLHILLIAPILYVLLYTVYKAYHLQLRKYIAPILMAVVGFAIRYYFGTHDWYESSKLNIIDALRENLPKLNQLASVQKLLHFSVNDHLAFSVLLFLAILFLVWEKRMFQLLLLLSFTVGYALVICVTNPTADKFYLENMILPLSIFLLLPLADFVLKKVFEMRIAFTLFVGILLINRFCCIYNAHIVYTNRLTYYSGLLNRMDEKKINRLVLKEKDVSIDSLLMVWASGYETILLSSLNNSNNAKVILINDDVFSKSNLMSDSVIIPRWDWPADQTRKRYFNIPKGHFVSFSN